MKIFIRFLGFVWGNGFKYQLFFEPFKSKVELKLHLNPIPLRTGKPLPMPLKAWWTSFSSEPLWHFPCSEVQPTGGAG